MKARIVAVIGVSKATPLESERAETAGRLLAERGAIVVTGGLGGVMEAASRGAAGAGGTVVGILPTDDPGDANAHVGIPIATGLGDARNAVIANAADAFIAIGRGLGTLSEIAFALKRGKPVVGVGSWDIEGVELAATPEEAVERLLMGPPF